MRRIGTLVTGTILGILALGVFRFATVAPPAVTHHHANWAVFIGGQRLDLTADRFMQDVAACRTDPDAIRPVDRVHLHENDHDVVHVHHPASTWGHLMTNLGMALGEDFLFTADGVRYFDGAWPESAEGTLRGGAGMPRLVFVRNGLQVPTLHDQPIRSEDRVVISFGTETPEEVLETRLPQVADNAAQHNEQADPGACMGSHEPEGWTDRLRRAFLG